MRSIWGRQLAGIPPAYRPGTIKLTLYAGAYAAAYASVGWLFFESGAMSALLACGGWYAAGKRAVRDVEHQKRTVASQFEQMLFSISSSLQAGKSIENAFRDVESDMHRLYAGGRPLLLKELEKLNRKVDTGIPAEEAIQQFQRNLAIDEIDSWADMVCTCKRTGGDLVQIMRQSSRSIIEKLNVERELAVLIAGKRFEAKALSVVPFLIVALFRYGSPEYMEPLYEGGGRAVMGAALALLGTGIALSERLMRIEA
ncbi:type II secretion system F family protein [Paenibacillus sp.]|uniref:type II secretion system F family protein n=1 Tax=Paenibacillus sp. TaxID=58172 RepID=UPI002D45C494|nr:type II secretion system F family protein [Paenibacillus sp.]HZG88512.1 type II secretion system F family protein [Paenibacillus sp.]